MTTKAIEILNAHEGEEALCFVEEANWRKANDGWLKWSRHLAAVLAGYMQENGLKRADLASRLGVSPQYVSRLLSGKENISFKGLANIEEKLGIVCFSMNK